MADPITPANVERELARLDSSTGVRMAAYARRTNDAPTEDIEYLDLEMIEEPGARAHARAKLDLPPLPPSVLARAKGRSLDPPTPGPNADPITRMQHELERVTRLQREQSAYVAELEKVLACRSQELLEADEREASLVRRFHEQRLRIVELERQVREQTVQIQELTATLPPRPLQTSELLEIRGIGPKYAYTLRALGVETLESLAALSEADVSRIEQQLRIRNGRIRRERWIEQARALLLARPGCT